MAVGRRGRVWFVGTLVSVAVGLCGPSSVLAATPVFRQVAGSPFTTGTEPFNFYVTFSPSGGLLATATDFSEGLGLLVFSVNSSTGALTRASGSPYVSDHARWMAFSPSGGLLAAEETGSSVSVFSVNSSTGALTRASGSPFSVDTDAEAMAFSPSGRLLAMGNSGNASVSVYSVATTRAPTPVAGSPFAVDALPDWMAFSPSGRLLAASDSEETEAGGGVAVFSVNSSTGAPTPVRGSPFNTGPYPVSVAFSPSGRLLAVANSGDDSVSVFSVNSDGTLTPVPGSSFSTGTKVYSPSSIGEDSMAFSPSGGLLAVPNLGGGDSVSVFSVNSDGTLTPVLGSPFATDGPPWAVAFSRSGLLLLATAKPKQDTVSVFSMPSAQITVEPSNQISVSHLEAHADGTVSFQVKVPGPGAVDVLQTAWDDNLAHIASVLQPAAHRFATGRAHADATHAGMLDLQVSDNAQGQRLIQHHRYAVTLRLWVSYTPTGGTQTSVGFYGLHLGGVCPDAASSGERTTTSCAA